jgi:predicted AAA+ superfamily ATPase
LELGGFPDPLTQGDKAYRLKWALDYRRLILREDLRDLSRIMEIDQVEKLWTLLPERVGSPLSIRSLQEDLTASHEAVRTWLLNLEKLFSVYTLPPYSTKIARAVKKERKIYLMDWALHQDEPKRFENFVISSLLRATNAWTDSGQGEFKVWYVRNVRSQEADFLITRDGKPWFIGDVKLSSTAIDEHVYSMADQLGKIPVIQIVQKSGIFQRPNQNSLVISADRFFAVFP